MCGDALDAPVGRKRARRVEVPFGEEGSDNRDVAPLTCPPATFNVTNGVVVDE